MKILITGAAGFIGYHFAKRLLRETDYEIVGIDNLNDYYDPAIKAARLRNLGIEQPASNSVSVSFPRFHFYPADLEDGATINRLFEQHGFDVCVNLAAQAGVRYSLENPHPYVSTNVGGFLNILEAARHFGIRHLIYASSSSVYGNNRKMPFSPADAVDHPVSLYAATKRANELMAHTYSHLFGIPTTGLRFFTVYGPLGRPDMAYFHFTKNILEGRPIKVFNHGQMKRDFTYVDDIAEAMYRLLDKAPAPGKNGEGPDHSDAPFALYNIGNHQPVPLMHFIETIERTVEKKANIEWLPMQPGDLEETYADIRGLQDLVDFQPSTPLEVGLPRFIEWYRAFYGV
ncbi:MAG: NAD-dependent epimerase [Lewinellaceae bacterium]|nr:NAD-dependent epimerase [Lewinellaceae bacterium]